MRAHWKGFVSLLGLLPVVGLVSPPLHAAPTPRDDAARCRALTGKTVAPHMTVVSADYAANGQTVGRIKVDTPFCRITGVATPTSDSHIDFEIWMPPADAWNGKYQQVGSGSSAGSIGTGAMLPALQAGYATLATDNGHVTDPDAPNGSNEQGWALGHPQKIIDFGYRAVHVSALAAKAIIAQFYGRKAEESYFVGCSTGGRQALMEAARYPADFNGIVAGAPAWRWVNQMINATWDSQAALKDPAALTEQSAAILNRAVIKTCDALDGVEDGVISDPRRCGFHPDTLQCKAGETDECLTPAQVDAAQRLYAGAHKSNGTRIFPGFTRGSELNWARVWAGPQPGGSSWDFWRYSVFQDKDFTNTRFDFDRDTDRALSAKVAGEPITAVYNAKPDLTRFAAHGGKLILYHGWADQQVSPLGSVDFYRQVVAREGKGGQAKTDNFLRLFMLPGINHCSGGPGAANIGGATPALQHDPQHDVVAALDNWVTHKTAPAVLIGAHLDQTKQVDRTRPLCPYPQEARYKGTGDNHDAANFVCAAPP